MSSQLMSQGMETLRMVGFAFFVSWLPSRPRSSALSMQEKEHGRFQVGYFLSQAQKRHESFLIVSHWFEFVFHIRLEGVNYLIAQKRGMKL